LTGTNLHNKVIMYQQTCPNYKNISTSTVEFYIEREHVYFCSENTKYRKETKTYRKPYTKKLYL